MKQRIQQNLKEALKAKREIEVSTLRLLLASILNREKEKRYKLAKEKPELGEKELQEGSQLTDEEIIEVVFSETKKRKEAILEFEKGKREDLVKQGKEEIEVLQKYLPEQLSEKEIEELARKIIEEVGAEDMKEFGKVMGNLMPKVKGKAEGQEVAQIVRGLLCQKPD